MSDSVSIHTPVIPGTDIPGLEVNGRPSGVYIGVSGHLAVTAQGPSGPVSVLYENLAPGVFHPISPISIDISGTTATGIVAVWKQAR